MRKFIPTVALAVMAATAWPGPVDAAPVKLGMTTEEAKAALVQPREIPILDMPNYTSLFSEQLRLTVGLCHERVTWIAEDAGKSLADFVFHVKETEAALGPAQYQVYQARASDGEMSYVTAMWRTPTGSFSIRHGLTYFGGEDVAMITSTYADDEATKHCK